MNLSDADKAALEAFLNTFTDAPMLADPKGSVPVTTIGNVEGSQTLSSERETHYARSAICPLV
jgi:hypothetical protein